MLKELVLAPVFAEMVLIWFTAEIVFYFILGNYYHSCPHPPSVLTGSKPEAIFRSQVLVSDEQSFNIVNEDFESAQGDIKDKRPLILSKV